MIPTAEEFNPLLKHFLQLNNASFPASKAIIQSLYLTGQQLHPHLINLLPQQALFQIWHLVDTNLDGKLYFNQFAVMMKIIKLVKQNQPIPSLLPAETIAFMKSGYTEVAAMQPLQSQPTGLFKQPSPSYTASIPSASSQFHKSPQTSIFEDNFKKQSLNDLEPIAPQHDKIYQVQQSHLQSEQSLLNQSTQQLNMLNSEFQTLNSTRNGLELQIKSTQEAMAKMQLDIQQLHINISQEQNTITVLERQVGEIQNEYTSVSNDKSKLQHDLQLLKDRKQQLNKELSTKTEEIAYFKIDANKAKLEQQQLKEEQLKVENELKKLAQEKLMLSEPDPFANSSQQSAPPLPSHSKPMSATSSPVKSNVVAPVLPVRTVSLTNSPQLPKTVTKTEFTKKFPDLDIDDPFAQPKLPPAISPSSQPGVLSKTPNSNTNAPSKPVESNLNDFFDEPVGSTTNNPAANPSASKDKPASEPQQKEFDDFFKQPSLTNKPSKPDFNDFDSFFSAPATNPVVPNGRRMSEISPTKVSEMFDTDFSFDSKFNDTPPKNSTGNMSKSENSGKNTSSELNIQQQEKLKKLGDMGFESQRALAVLKETNWNLEAAIEKLF